MTQKLSRKHILNIALACLLCLGIGMALGYGIRTQELRATAAAAGAENGDDLVGASRPIITGDEIFMACKSCGFFNVFPSPLPEGDLLCKMCKQPLQR